MAQKRSKLDLMITAIHEAGHAVAAYQLGYMPTLVTIRARGENRGCTHYRRVRIHPNEDATSQRRKAEHAILPFNYPQFRPLRWLPIPDRSNEIAPSTSRHCLELDLLPDSDNHLVLRSSSGSAQVFWLEAAFCSCLSQNGQATLSQDRSMQFSETRSESLGSSSSTRKPASSGCRTPISGSQDAPQFEASTLLRDNLTLVSCGTFQFSTSWRTNRASQRRPGSIGQANQ